MLRRKAPGTLFLPETVGDEGLACLEDFAGVVRLVLSGGYTDRALEHVAKLKQLSTLVLHNTQITREGLRQLQRKRPGVLVEFEYSPTAP